VEKSIALMMETVVTPETSVNFNQTKRYNIPENCYIRKAATGT
jgi:hypothetical protein